MFSDTEDIANAANLPLFETECENQAGSDKSESAMSDSTNFAVRVQNISKCYQIYDAPRDRLKQFVVPRLQRLLGKTPQHYFREFWALKDVSLEIKKGQTIGIIGRNGSGKSTLLQIICGTLSPTNGLIETNGRIAALLELGSGFNPEFTGRENVYMNAAVLGLTKEEIEARYSDIQAFADIGDFIDQPVKSYSSGMVVRLAFAVAINVAPGLSRGAMGRCRPACPSGRQHGRHSLGSFRWLPASSHGDRSLRRTGQHQGFLAPFSSMAWPRKPKAG